MSLGLRHKGLGDIFNVCGVQCVPMTFEVECVFFGSPIAFSLLLF